MTTKAIFRIGLTDRGLQDWKDDRQFIVHRLKTDDRAFCGRYIPHVYSYLPVSSRKALECELCRKWIH